MSQARTPAGGGPDTPATGENQVIWERVRELTTDVLQHGRLDTEGIAEVIRGMAGGQKRSK